MEARANHESRSRTKGGGPYKGPWSNNWWHGKILSRARWSLVVPLVIQRATRLLYIWSSIRKFRRIYIRISTLLRGLKISAGINTMHGGSKWLSRNLGSRLQRRCFSNRKRSRKGRVNISSNSHVRWAGHRMYKGTRLIR